MTRMMATAAEVSFQALLHARGGNLQEVFRNSQARTISARRGVSTIVIQRCVAGDTFSSFRLFRARTDVAGELCEVQPSHVGATA
jgi:hypothetical protein